MSDDDQAVTRRARAASRVRMAGEGDARIGTTVAGRYKLLRKVGQGGMGVVYLAEHVLIEKKVAVKLVTGDFARQKEAVARFIQEAKAASRIGHENIIDITDCGETGTGSVFIAMEYLEGRDLAELLDETVVSSTRATGTAPLPLVRVARILNQVCRGLGAAHAKGIVHRDLKPSNIFLVQREGRPDVVKILDFGLAKMASPGEGGPRLTAEGTIFGTAEYMSPEQARGETADGRTDVYAAGCILYQMLTGDVPFHAPAFMSLLRCHLEEPVVPPRERAPEAMITAELDAVVLKALAKDRAERYQTMKELALALCAATGGAASAAWSEPGVTAGAATGEIPARPGNSPLPTHSPSSSALRPAGATTARGAWRLAVAVVAIGGAVGGWAWRSHRRGSPAATTPTTLPAPATGTTEPAATVPRPGKSRLALRTSPSEALVMRGPEVLGETPLTLDLDSAALPFEVTLEKKGFLTQRLEVAPDRDREYVVHLTPVPRKEPRALPRPPSSTTVPPSTRTPRELKDIFEE